jgi:phosphate-selective porin OprO/OprP
MALSIGWVLPAQAQSADSAAVAQELAAMRAQMAQMAARIDTLEGQLANANAKAEAATSAAGAASAALAKLPPPSATAKPATEVTWDGAPKLATKDGWSFKPRGRLQIDAGSVSAPAMPTAPQQRELGFASRFRRAYLGFDGTIPGGFGYRMEIDVAGSSVALTDLYLTYKPRPDVTLTLGQQKPFWGLEEMQSDLFTSFMERASYSTAFGFERRVGLSAAYQGHDLLVQAGAFTDDAASLGASDSDNSYSLDGRVVFMPKLGDGQLHLGASIHYRMLKDLGSSALRYQARPSLRTTDLRFVDTGTIAGATGERGLGLEALYVAGRLHASAEAYWQKVARTGLADPTFNGGYAELGYLLTDDVTAYRGGVLDRIRPKHPVGQGGMGALQLNLRYDWLDLVDAGIVGGNQQTAGVSLIWIPTDYVRFIAQYGHMWIKDSPILAGGSPDYGADSFGLRAQFDF